MTIKSMTRMLGVTIVAGVLAAAGTMGQDTQNNPDQNNSNSLEKKSAPAVTIPLSTGTPINASLLGTLDSERCKPGDPVSAIVTESVVYQRSVLLPKGSRIVGHVVRTGGDGDETAALFVEFDRAILKNGQEAELNAGIQALAPVGTAPTIPSREKYEEARMAGLLGRAEQESSGSGTLILPSTYTLPKRAITPELTTEKIEGGIDHKGLFTPDSKGAFSDPSLKVFTPISEGSHGTVLVNNKRHIRLENGTHLLIVVQPPAEASEGR
jgi:hypothetical protein